MTDTDALVNLFDTEFESTHAMQHKARRAYVRISSFLADLRQNAEQLDRLQIWYRILSEALRFFLKGRQLQPPLRLNPA